MGNTYLLPRKVVPASTIPHAYAVVSNSFALALHGSYHFGTKNGTMYATFGTQSAAQAYHGSNDMRLYAKVVQLY